MQAPTITIKRERSREEQDLITKLDLKPIDKAEDGAFERQGYPGKYYLQRNQDGLASVWYTGGRKADGTIIPPQTFRTDLWNGSRVVEGWVREHGNDKPLDSTLLLPKPRQEALRQHRRDDELKIINELGLTDAKDIVGGKAVRAADGSFTREGYKGRYYLQRESDGSCSVWYSGVRDPETGKQVGSCTYINGRWSTMDWAPKSDVLLREHFPQTAALVLPGRAGYRA